MKQLIRNATILGAVIAGAAQAQTINVSNDITVSTTWTKNNRYNLTKQIYVTNGATLTIQAGTIIENATGTLPPPNNGGGSLAVTRGSKIYALGSADEPVIMTSSNDAQTWPNGNPKQAVEPEPGNRGIPARS